MMLNNSCKAYRASFASLLDNINVGSMPSTPYTKRYLQHLLDHRHYYIAIYAHVLDSAIEKSKQSKTELNLLDFGAGNGLLGLFARHCGFNKVFLCDINSNFVDASRLVAQQMNLSIDGFIVGELSQVSEALQTHLDIIVGTDVIEHIYNLDHFFKSITHINPQMITVFSTASNPDNFYKVRQLKKLQVKDEFVGGDPEDFALAGEEKHAAYVDIRKAILQKHLPHMPASELLQWAQASRGLREDDIVRLAKGQPVEIDFPFASADTNTCHPYTGSWSERILSINNYQQLYNRYGYTLQLKNGFYNSFDGRLKRAVNIFMNLLIKILGRKTAPFITLIGFPHK
ncbi:MAG: methyltransferase domain-containing protein [Chitinophagaceae bacterium]|nr:MAG: methyltransferase domain-containing protein [Chitinophagaceae bacterium]